MSEKITFFDIDTNEETDFYVIEETRINNMNYLLVTESDDDNDTGEEETAYILKDMSSSEESEAKYEMVEDDDELEYVSKIFSELLEDVDIDC